MNRSLKNVSKAFALVLALVMVLGVAVPVFAAPEVASIKVTVGEQEATVTEGEGASTFIAELEKKPGEEDTVVLTIDDTPVDTTEDDENPGTYTFNYEDEDYTLTVTVAEEEVEEEEEEVEEEVETPAPYVLEDVVPTEFDGGMYFRFAFKGNESGIVKAKEVKREVQALRLAYLDKETEKTVGYFTPELNRTGEITYSANGFNPDKHYVVLRYWTHDMDLTEEGVRYDGLESGDVVVLKTAHDLKAKNIQVLGGPENAGLEDVDFEITVKNKNGDVVDSFTDTVGSTDKHGFYDWGQHVEVDEEGISPAEAEKKGVAPENGVVLVDGVAIPVGGTIEFKPVESTLPEGFVYNKDLKLVINPWERHTNYLRQGEVDGTVEPDNADLYIYTAELPEIANPYVINYNYDQVRVIVKVFTRGDKYTEEMPVVDSTINVYTADWDETGRVKEGKLVDTVKTDKNGFAEFMLDKSELVKVFNANGFTEIEVPYVLKQVDGGSDLNVVPYDGLIWATGDYNWAGLKLGASEDAEFEFTVNDLGEDTLKITIRNTRDAVNEVVEEDIFTQAVELAKKQFETGLVKGNDEYKDVVIATVEEAKLADALTAGSVAALYDAPLLLVEEDKLPEVVAEYIEEAKAERAIVIGGPNTVSDEVVTELEKIAGTVFRISGSNRWETATEVAKRVQKEFGQDTVLLANGEGNDKFIDSLAVAAVSAEYGYPVVLTAGDFLPAETADFLGSFDVETVHVIGGEHSVAESVVRAVNAELKSGTTIDRVAGENRFETAVAIADKFFADAETAVFVNGDKNDLALLAGPYAAANNAPVILVGEDVPESVQKYLPESKISKAILVGETPEEVRLEIAELIREY